MDSHSSNPLCSRLCCISPPSSVQLLSCVWLSVTPWTAASQASLSIIKAQSLLKLMSIESVMPSNHLILCRPLLLPPSIFSQHQGLFQWVSSSYQWLKYWSFSFSISPSKAYSGLISFRMDWLDLLAVQGTLKSLLQHHSSKASILRCSAFFIVQLLQPHMTTGKPISLTRWTFAGKVMFLLFNTLSRMVIVFLPRSKHLLISWLQSPYAVILESKKIKSVIVFIGRTPWTVYLPYYSYFVVHSSICVLWMKVFINTGLLSYTNDNTPYTHFPFL